MALKQNPLNPYVGPRTFETHERHLFFGRAREARELFSLAISERLVLFYAQSGAGKSSLINTQLIPDLRAEGFEALPVGRVSGTGLAAESPANIYLYNLLLSLHRSQAETPATLARLSLADFLDNLVVTPAGEAYYSEGGDEEAAGEDEEELHPRLLIIDQFEEILTTNLPAWDQRPAFFEHLQAALAADPYLWLVLVIREDYVAGLEPYAALLPGHLRARYYMQRMSYEAALEAVKRPAELAGRPFAAGVAESLVDNLRQIRVQGQAGTLPGQFVEPVQLQVVCYQLWENLQKRLPDLAGFGNLSGLTLDKLPELDDLSELEITAQDVQELGNVDTALAEFYEQALAEAIAATGVAEIALRHWFDSELITEAGTRGTVYRGARQSGGLDNATVEVLARRFLLRAEVRTGGTWYELVHDRFVEPIRQANRRWRERQPLLQMAQAWLEAGRNEALLLEGPPLQEALASNWQGLGPLVEEFLTAGRQAQQARLATQEAEREARRQRELETAHQLAEEAEARRAAEAARAREQAEAAGRLRQRLLWLVSAGLLILLMLLVAVALWLRATENAEIAIAYATESAQQAEEARQQATVAQGYATESAQQAEEAQQQATVAQGYATESAQQADEAQQQAATAEAYATESAQKAAEARQQAIAARAAEATAVREATAAAEARDALVANLEAQIAAATVTPAPTPETTPEPVGEDATPIPTATATPTPAIDTAATGTAVAVATLQVQLAELNATQTVAARRSAQLVYVQGGDQSVPWLHALAIISGEGNTLQNLVQYAGAPAWSPDGNQVAFVGEPGGLYEAQGPGLWLIQPQSRNTRQLVKSDDIDNLAWSPDGSRLAYEIRPPGQPREVVIIEARTGRELKRFPGEYPAWRPDNQRLAILRCEPACGLWLVTPENREAERLTDHGSDFLPTWSPDGRYLAFCSRRQDNDWELYRLDTETGEILRLTNRPGSDVGPVFSPDGQEIYFRTDAFGGWRLNALNLDGRQERLVREGVGASESWGLARPAVR